MAQGSDSGKRRELFIANEAEILAASAASRPF
jgi:hypothetical protein